MNNLPIYVSIVFGLTTFLTIWFFFKAINAFRIAFGIIIFLSALQAILGFSGFYLNQNTIPPRLIFLILPSLILIIGLFTTQKGRQFIDSLDIKALTILHIVRIPVEIVLYWLFLAHTIPQLMTFEGRNFDILSGLTAPLVFYFGFVKQKLPKNASPVRLHNRCKLTGRPRGYMRQFGLSRVTFREMANNGLIPGVKKASW